MYISITLHFMFQTIFILYNVLHNVFYNILDILIKYNV